MRRVGVAVAVLTVLASLVGGWAATSTLAAAPSTPLAWGRNQYGQIGNGGNGDVYKPAQVIGLAGAASAIAGGTFHTLALKSDGTVWAWGLNSSGQLGNGTTIDSSTPVQVSALGGGTAVAGMNSHSLALKSDGTVRAWGDNADGQLGNGTAINSSTPVQVIGLTGATAIAGGFYHSLALKSNGTVWAWGSNGSGQLGNGTLTSSSTPVPVSGLTGVTAIAGGIAHSLALKSDGTVWAWGSNPYGQLGNGTTTDSSTPVRVSGLSGATAIAGGGYHSLAVRSDGTAWDWGYNLHGQLGNGTTADSHTPVQVSGLSGATIIAGGQQHSLVLKSDRTIWAWGSNSNGQLGNGTTADSSTPVQVSGLSGVTAIAGGGAHSLANATVLGFLRVVFVPPYPPTQILVDGQIADSWGLNWLKLPAGSHTVCYTHVDNWTEPPCETVTVNYQGETQTLGSFVPRGYLRVITSPAVNSQITVDGNPTDEYGMWTDVPPGLHTVCFGKVIGYDPPSCQTANVPNGPPGTQTTITGTFTPNPSAVGQTGVGLLRAVTSPAVPSQIMIKPSVGNAYIADSWGLNWLELAPGSYTVSFSHVQGYTEPPPQTVTVTAGATAMATGTFTRRGWLRVLTSPSVPGTISVDGIPRDDYGMWTDFPTGSHMVCFGPAASYANTPACQTVTVTAGATTTVTGTYN